MLENAIYSVISPEGCASILWKDAGRAAEAAECLKLTSDDLLALGVIERIIPEEGKDLQTTFSKLKAEIMEFIAAKQKLAISEIVEERYQKFRKIK